MGIFSLIGGFLGGNAQKKASRKGEAAMLEYLGKGIDEQRRQFDITREDFAPYTAAGGAAMGEMGDYLGLNGEDEWTKAMAALQESPFLQSIIRNGEEALLQNGSATGGLRGGNMQRGLADFRGDAFVRALQQHLGNLGGVAGMGSGMTSTLGALGANKAGAISDLFGAQGSARAGGILTRGGINAGVWNSMGPFFDQAMQAFMPGGGGMKSIF